MKKIVALALAVVTLLSICTVFSSCSNPPKYEEIEERFKWLVENSYEVNVILFGEGLPTDERIYDPWSNMETYERKDENGNTLISSIGKPLLGYYYYTEDDSYGRIIAYREGATSDTVYLEVEEAPRDGVEAVYVHPEKALYYYSTEYKPAVVSRYYTEADPDNYDYVAADCEYKSIEQIKMKAEEVYSKDYLENTLYESLFTGVMVDENTSGLSAKFMEYTDSEYSGSAMLMQSNTFPILVNERRIFDFSTAKIVKPGSNKLVNIEVETYLESKPDTRTLVRVTLVLQDGEWFLDSGTY